MKVDNSIPIPETVNCTDSQRNKMESKRTQIRMPDEWIAAVDKQAKRSGQSFSEWVREAIRRKLPATIRKQLPEVKSGRPKHEAE